MDADTKAGIEEYELVSLWREAEEHAAKGRHVLVGACSTSLHRLQAVRRLLNIEVVPAHALVNDHPQILTHEEAIGLGPTSPILLIEPSMLRKIFSGVLDRATEIECRYDAPGMLSATAEEKRQTGRTTRMREEIAAFMETFRPPVAYVVWASSTEAQRERTCVPLTPFTKRGLHHITISHLSANLSDFHPKGVSSGVHVFYDHHAIHTRFAVLRRRTRRIVPEVPFLCLEDAAARRTSRK